MVNAARCLEKSHGLGDKTVNQRADWAHLLGSPGPVGRRDPGRPDAANLGVGAAKLNPRAALASQRS